MAERDRFELDLAAALRTYLEEAPTEVRPTELARQFATAYPHRRAALGPWHLPTALRPAWILLLLAGLLAALVGGTLFVGSQIQRRLPAVVPPIGKLFTCPPGSKPDEPGPADQARPSDAGPMAFDRAAGKIVMLARSGTWTFDVCTNTWVLMQAGAVPDTGLALVYDPGADLVISVDYPEHPVARPPHAWAYSLADNTWTRKGPAPDYVARLWYDTASAQVAAWAAGSDEVPGTIWTYDVTSDAWAAVGALEVLGGYGWGTPGDLLAYDAGLDRVVATVTAAMDAAGTGVRLRTRLFDMHTGSVVDVAAVAPWAGACGFMSNMYCYDGIAGAAIAYDDRAGRTVVRIGDHMFAYAADRWDTLYEPGAADTSDAGASASAAASALARESWSMVSDPVNGRLVVLGGVGGATDAVLAFDATTRAWTVLLDPSKVQPTPTP